MDNEPTPRETMIRLLNMYADLNSRKHIRNGMKRMLQEYRRDLAIRYGTLSQKQFESIVQYLIYEFRKIDWDEADVRNFFAPIIRAGIGRRQKPVAPKPKPEPSNTLEEFFRGY